MAPRLLSKIGSGIDSVTMAWLRPSSSERLTPQAHAQVRRAAGPLQASDGAELGGLQMRFAQHRRIHQTRL